MVKWVVWGQEGLDSWDSLIKGIGFGLPGVESQTTGPQTSNIANIGTFTTFSTFVCLFYIHPWKLTWENPPCWIGNTSSFMLDFPSSHLGFPRGVHNSGEFFSHLKSSLTHRVVPFRILTMSLVEVAVEGQPGEGCNKTCYPHWN